MKSKILLYSIFILFILFFSSIWYLLQVNEAAKNTFSQAVEEKRMLEKKISDLHTIKVSLESDINSINNEKAQLLKKIAQYEEKLTEATSEIVKLRSSVPQLESLKAEISIKNDELLRKNSEIELLRKGMENYENEIAALNSKLADSHDEQARNRPEKQVDLEPITVTSKSKRDNAKVLEVNNEYGFLVTDLGSVDGIKKQDILFVFRNAQLLGKVIVERVGDTVSVAKILYKTLADKVKKGDLVSY